MFAISAGKMIVMAEGNEISTFCTPGVRTHLDR
jgi:hypothetical protein